MTLRVEPLYSLTMTTDQPAAARPGWRSILLGLFVLFQVIYLPLANLLLLVPRDRPAPKAELDEWPQSEGLTNAPRWVRESINVAGTAADRWSEFSGQEQMWSLFAEFGKQSIFPVVQCKYQENQAITLRPKNFPHNFDRYFHWPNFLSRLNGYDFLMGVVYWHLTDASLHNRPDDWRQAVLERVRRQQRSLEAYFRFTLSLYRAKHPELPMPIEMILNIHMFPSPQPGSTERPKAMVQPLARWFPDKEPAPGFLPVEVFDPVLERWVALPKEEKK